MGTDTIVKLFIPFVLAVIMLAMGLGLRVVDFKRVVVEPRAVLIGSVAQLVMLPAVGFLLAGAFGLSPPLAVGLVLVTACPGGPSSNLYSHFARGDTALSVTLTAVSGVITIVSIPFVVNLALDHFMGEGRTVHLPIAKTILSIVLAVGLPLAIGMVIRAKRPVTADRIEPWVKRAAVLLLTVLIIGALVKEQARVGTYFAELGLPVLTLSLVTIALGMLLGFGARLSRGQSVTIGIEVGMQSAALAIGIAMTSLESEEIAMPAVIYGVLAYFTCAVPLVIGRMIIPPRQALAATEATTRSRSA